MVLFHEIALAGGATLELIVHDDLRYRLRYGDLVEYENGRRRVRGRATAYEFRSVEQLRYDFEQDIAAQAA
ncbi:MAG TPA: hypothetical protein VFC18_03035 [Burkholderiales bacterium]|nr:hypothetical protein [Burkholderiales bacterium]